MIDDLVQNIGQYVHTNPWLAVVAVFLGGALTASNPCVIAMIPLMMSFVAGRTDVKVGPVQGFLHSLVFVLGLAVTFVALGMVAALAGTLYGDVSGVWTWIVVAVCLVMGLHLLGVLKFTIPMPVRFQPKTRGFVGAFMMGLLFGIVSAPCAAPILILLLTYVARPGSSVAYGGTLLFVYALGHSVLILLAGTFMGVARKLIESRNVTRATDLMRRAAGVVIIGIGAFFAYNALH